MDFSMKIILMFWLFLKEFDENCLLWIEKSTVLVFSNLVFRLSNGFDIYEKLKMTPLSKKSPVLLVENSKSHGSVTVRFGAIIFGLGTFVYFFIELLDFLQIKMWDSDLLSIRDHSLHKHFLSATTFSRIF